MGIVAVLVIIAGIIFYIATKPVPAKAPGISDAGIVLPANGYSEHSKYYDIVANYPTTTPLTGAANDSAIALIRSFIGQTIAQFKNGPPDSGAGNNKNTLQITYLIGSSAHTLSYIFTMYEDTGGVHSNVFFHTFVFDTATGRNLSLADLFMPGTPYLDTLSRMSRARLPDVIGSGIADIATIDNGTAPTNENFSDFFFDNTDFVILFPPYQVASYAAGPQTLRIPLSELSSILKPEYRNPA